MGEKSFRLKIVYAGTPEYAAVPLEALVRAGCTVTAVITAPDRPAGRRGLMTPPPVKEKAKELGIPVHQFAKIRDHADEVRSMGADMMITCSFGQILSDEILAIFPRGVWNLHASLLPRHRGASPVQAAIAAGDEYTGVTVMKTERALDCGGMLLAKRCEIGSKTCGELSVELSRLSALAAVEAVTLIEEGDTALLVQDEGAATYCGKITKSDAKIDFSLGAGKVVRLINAMNPDPVAYCRGKQGDINMYRAETCALDGGSVPGEVVTCDRKHGITVKCGKGYIRILEAQFAGGRRMSWGDIVNGGKMSRGDILE